VRLSLPAQLGLLEQPAAGRRFVEQPAAAEPVRLLSLARTVTSGSPWPFEQTWHLAGSAIRRVEQPAALTGTAEQAAVTDRTTEYADFVVVVAAVGHVKEADDLAR
jgi:hypothetical protein